MRFTNTNVFLGTIFAFILVKPEIPPMKTTTIPTKKLALLCTAFCAAAMLAFTPDAKALDLTFTDQHVVGTTTPGNPPPTPNVAIWINYMITLGLGQSGNIQNQTVTRSNNAFANLPNADANIFLRDSSPNPSTTINLGAGGVYTYLFAKYDGQNDKSLVWNVANLTGTIRIPQLGPQGHGLSVWILFGPGTPGVPDGGTTVMLLGAALGALGIARRYIMR